MLTFENEKSICPNYCLPSLIAIDENKQFYFGSAALKILQNERFDDGIRLLKILVGGRYYEPLRNEKLQEQYDNYIHKKLGSNNYIHCENMLALYLAYTFLVVRQKIENSPEFKNTKIDPIFNVCVPLTYESHCQLGRVFNFILAWAELIYKGLLKSKNIHPLDYCFKVMEQVSYDENNPETRVFPVPEAVAEIMAFVKSLQCTDGLYALMDFGAGTTDISIFNLCNSSADPIAYFYESAYLPKGTNIIENEIANILNKEIIYKELPALYRIMSRDSKIESNVIKGVIHSRLQSLWEDSKRIWGNAYQKNKAESSWRNVKIFTSGGGARIPEINEVFCVPWAEKFQTIFTYKMIKLPVPDSCDTLNQQVDFNRLSVAFGLCFPKPEIFKCVKPHQCPNQTPIKSKKNDRVIEDGGHVLPNRNWI
ncbi:hypothetical protein JW935_13695 [candidate division KSB1 bacterium]|nr:hypothetical protein [candidate division KSB1 bacterium]